MNKLYKLSFSNENQWHNKRAKWFNEPDDGLPSGTYTVGGFPSGTYTVDGCTIIELGYTPKKPIYDDDGNITNPDAKNTDYSVDVYGVNDKIKDKFVINNPASWYHVISGVDTDLVLYIPSRDLTELTIVNTVDTLVDVIPTTSNTKIEIQEYLTLQDIDFAKSWNKTKLLSIVIEDKYKYK